MERDLRPKISERHLRLSMMSGRAMDYIMIGELVRFAPDEKMKEALRITQLKILKELLPGDVLDIAEFGRWQTEVIKNASRID